VSAYWSQKWMFLKFVNWRGKGRISACLVEFAPQVFASHVPVVANCGSHQWISDLARFRFSDVEDRDWVEESVDRLKVNDRCIYCEAIRTEE
jgi:hypothetical protein